MNTDNSFRVDGIDHVELFVSDREAAVDWYQTVLGLETQHAFDRWADTGGPVLCSSDGGATNLAFFEDERRSGGESTGFRRVAFEVSADGFHAFLERSEELALYNPDGGRLEELEVVDHELSYSVYFCDPDGNRLEVTTYEYDEFDGDDAGETDGESGEQEEGEEGDHPSDTD